MPVPKPYRRTCRPFKDGQYPVRPKVSYIAHSEFAKAPKQYIHAFELIQKDLLELFDYVEPADRNRDCHSLRIVELLLRTCVEVEANCKAILRENAYGRKKNNWTMEDYKKLNRTHRLSSYQVKFPVWHGAQNVCTPFLAWSSGKGSDWYNAYNQTKHDRHAQFEQANFGNLLDAVAGLVALIASQFHTHDFSLRPTDFSDDIDQQYLAEQLGDFSVAIGGYFGVKFPNDWPVEQRYSFDWDRLKTEADPFQLLQIR